jgi:hypothetical protein
VDKLAVRTGAVSVLQVSAVSVTSLLFVPGLLIRVACQLVAAATRGSRVRHHSFFLEFAGEVEIISGPQCWIAIALGTFFPLTILGTFLLGPSIVRFGLLDVQPFQSISFHTVFSHDTPLLPFLQTYKVEGRINFLRLWFGVSCFFSCIPAQSTVGRAREILRDSGVKGMTRLVCIPLFGLFRSLQALDAALMFGFAGSYLASGTLVLVSTWWVCSRLAEWVLT